ncbi:MAG TPA: type IX secretion system plug protein domain-containing protein [Bacteroidota bacterium]|nr:type IX secretion system plug protein domain-containing protein [Bacteroidota bacterium]
MKKVLFLILASYSLCFAQAPTVSLLGLRIYASDDEYLPPVISVGQKVTIEFDISAEHPPNLQIVFAHATKDWKADNNVFLNQDYHTKSQQLQFTVAPNGVHHYDYHYKNDFPDDHGVVLFPYSGNYLFAILDEDMNDEVLGEGRFIVLENAVGISMRVDNAYYPGKGAPYNQMNLITVKVDVPPDEEQLPANRINHLNVKCVDIIQNWKLYDAFRIDVDDDDPDTFVEQAYRPEKKFSIRNVPPGNEYRRLDIGSPRLYPNEEKVRLREGADLSRFEWQGTIDANGAAKLRPFTGANSDYLDVEFRLELPSPSQKDIYLVGAFNQWQIRDDFKMELDPSKRMYSLHKWIRRGVYDYQYVTASIDSVTGEANDADWIALEGNDWRTINRYIAVVYYHDDRFGGFDRAVGSAVAKSPGGTSETKSDN